MKLSLDKRFIKAGDIVEVTWDAEDAFNARIVMHMGERETELAVPLNGTKKFRIKDSRGQHWIGLKVIRGNREKVISKRLFVFGQRKTTDEFEYMDDDNKPFNRFNRAMTTWWSTFSPEKKRLYILLLLLLGYQFLIAAFPQFAHVLLYGVIFWLFWQIVKN